MQICSNPIDAISGVAWLSDWYQHLVAEWISFLSFKCFGFPSLFVNRQCLFSLMRLHGSGLRCPSFQQIEDDAENTRVIRPNAYSLILQYLDSEEDNVQFHQPLCLPVFLSILFRQSQKEDLNQVYGVHLHFHLFSMGQVWMKMWICKYDFQEDLLVLQRIFTQMIAGQSRVSCIAGLSNLF